MLSCSVMSDSAIPWTVAQQAPLSMLILQARILEWVAIPTISYSRGPSQFRDGTRVSRISYFGRQILYHQAAWKALKAVHQMPHVELKYDK